MPHTLRWLATLLLLVQLTVARRANSQPPAPAAKITQVTLGELPLELIDNSTTFSQALAINASGAVVGQREIANADLTILSSEYFFCDDKQTQALPRLEGFTNMEASALSDNNLAVGYASRPIGHPDGSLVAIVWDPSTGDVTPLPRPPEDVGSHAQDISGDGKRITGYATGDARMRPCVWSWNEADQQWVVEVLPTKHQYNPYIMSSRTIISPDGKLIASCCTFDIQEGIVDSALYLWREVDGQWQNKLLNERQLYLRDINNAGMMVGSVTADRALRQPVVVQADGKFQPIELLPGDESGEAWGVNAAGVVVGFSDDPRGLEGGPQAFVWQDGKTRALALGEGVFSVGNSINDAGQIAGSVDAPTGDSEPQALERTLAFRTLQPSSKPRIQPPSNN